MLDFYLTFFAGPDWVSVFSFFAVSAFYFLAPRLGYRLHDPMLFINSLYLLVVIMVVNFLASRLLPERDILGSPKEINPLVPILAWLKAGMQLGVFVLFIRDLKSLQLADSDQKPPEDDQQPEKESPASGVSQHGDSGHDPGTSNVS